MTFIDPVTGWFEITEVTYIDQSSARISQLYRQMWLSRYPSLKKVCLDNGSEFRKKFIPLLKDFFSKPKTTEGVHQVVGDMLRTHDSNIMILTKWTPGSQFFKNLLGQSLVPTTQQMKSSLEN